MFKFFERKSSKTQVLVIINGNAGVPVDYSVRLSKVNDSLKTEVQVACSVLSISLTHEETEKIVDALKHGESYWLNETWGFQILEIDI